MLGRPQGTHCKSGCGLTPQLIFETRKLLLLLLLLLLLIMRYNHTKVKKTQHDISRNEHTLKRVKRSDFCTFDVLAIHQNIGLLFAELACYVNPISE